MAVLLDAHVTQVIQAPDRALHRVQRSVLGATVEVFEVTAPPLTNPATVLDADGNELSSPFTTNEQGRVIHEDAEALYLPGARDVDVVATKGIKSWQIRVPVVSGEDASVAAPSNYGLRPVKVRPVIKHGLAGTWNSALIEGGGIFWIDEWKVWGFVAAGYNGTLTPGFPFVPDTSQGKIGLWVSADKEAWFGAQSDPIFELAGQSITGPQIIPKRSPGGDLYYHLFYIETNDLGYEGIAAGVGVTRRIGWAVSDANSALGPYTRQGIVIQEGGGGWYDKWIWRPNINLRNGRWHMFLNATAADNLERIGHAVTDDIENPDFEIDEEPLLEADSSLADPCLYPFGVNNDELLSYTKSTPGAGYIQDLVAIAPRADFPEGPWVDHIYGPVLYLGAPYDGLLCGKPTIDQDGGSGTIRHFFVCVDSTTTEWSIALAQDGERPKAEARHTVGATGEPAFGSPWSSGAGASYRVPQYWSDGEGKIHLSGVLSCSAGVTAYSSYLFTLPPSHRPGTRGPVLHALTDQGVSVRLDVLANGQIAVVATIASGRAITLDGLYFPQ